MLTEPSIAMMVQAYGSLITPGGSMDQALRKTQDGVALILQGLEPFLGKEPAPRMHFL